MQYLLDYQHGCHHPREDRLYRLLAAAQPALRAEMKRLDVEHATGERQAKRLAQALRGLTPARAAGRAGARVAGQLQSYVDETREHMRREERVVFYADVAPLLAVAEWHRLLRQEPAADPLAEPALLAQRYPALARVLSEKVYQLSAGGRSKTAASVSAIDRSLDAAGEAVSAFADTYGELLHDGIGVVRANTASVVRAGSLVAAARAVPSIVERSCRYVRRCIELPSRLTLESLARVLAPLLPQRLMPAVEATTSADPMGR